MNFNLNTTILGLAALLFVVALFALTVWAFKSVFGDSGTQSTRKGREKRLGVVETATVDANRKLCLIRRDDVEHLLIIGGPVDVVVETGIKGRPHLNPSHGDVVIAKNEPRPAPKFARTEATPQ